MAWLPLSWRDMTFLKSWGEEKKKKFKQRQNFFFFYEMKQLYIHLKCNFVKQTKILKCVATEKHLQIFYQSFAAIHWNLAKNLSVLPSTQVPMISEGKKKKLTIATFSNSMLFILNSINKIRGKIFFPLHYIQFVALADIFHHVYVNVQSVQFYKYLIFR